MDLPTVRQSETLRWYVPMWSSLKNIKEKLFSGLLNSNCKNVYMGTKRLRQGDYMFKDGSLDYTVGPCLRTNKHPGAKG